MLKASQRANDPILRIWLGGCQSLPLMSKRRAERVLIF